MRLKWRKLKRRKHIHDRVRPVKFRGTTLSFPAKDIATLQFYKAFIQIKTTYSLLIMAPKYPPIGKLMINTVIKLEYLPIETNIYKIVVINVTILIIIPSIVFLL